jgi:hypothetical protein
MNTELQKIKDRLLKEIGNDVIDNIDSYENQGTTIESYDTTVTEILSIFERVTDIVCPKIDIASNGELYFEWGRFEIIVNQERGFVENYRIPVYISISSVVAEWFYDLRDAELQEYLICILNKYGREIK